MIFYLVMPVLYGGIGNYMVPVYQGTSEVGFPRTNGSSLLVLVPVSLAYILVSVCMEYPGGTGWTLYPPLALTLPTPTGTMVTILALVSNGWSSVLGSINFYSTVGSMQCPGLTLGYLYLLPVGVSILFLLLLMVLPVLTGALGTLVSDTYSIGTRTTNAIVVTGTLVSIV